ncbi:MAG TPA: tlde1 domain-containing protein [bacterium]
MNGPVDRDDPFGLAWVYSRSSGQLTHEDPPLRSVDVGTGYSGHGLGLNNPTLQFLRNVGPIPQGTWTIGPQQNNTTGSGTNLPASMRLTPAADTQTLGRDGFLIHGDNGRGNRSASQGCPVFNRNIRNQIGGSDDNTLVVIP